MIKKVADKILEYGDLTTEIKRTRNVEMKMIPVITRETATISKPFIKHSKNAPAEHKVKELQKTAILGTAYILWKVLM